MQQFYRVKIALFFSTLIRIPLLEGFAKVNTRVSTIYSTVSSTLVAFRAELPCATTPQLFCFSF